jgi:predicted nucleotidyltransferase
MRMLALTAPELAEVRRVLAEHLPPGMSVAAFGSRAAGTSKPWSDLDLSLGGPVALPLLAELAEAFDESTLSFKVDLIDRAAVGPDFGAIIDGTALPVWP